MGSIPTLASTFIKDMSLIKTYKFITDKNDEILIKAYFREEAIIEFEEKYNLTEWTMYCLDDDIVEEW